MKSKGHIEANLTEAKNAADMLLKELVNNNPFLTKDLIIQRTDHIIQKLEIAIARLELEED